MDILNSLNKIFIDFLAYIPSVVLKIILLFSYIFLYDFDLWIKVIWILNNYKVEFIIIIMSLMYFIDIVFSFFAKPFKISRTALSKEQIDKIIKPNSDLKEVYEYQWRNHKWFTSSLLDISNHVWYDIPMFFENKILLFKSLRSTLIVFSYINTLFTLYFIYAFDLIYILSLIVVNIVYLFLIYVLKKEIKEYHFWYLAWLLNINFYLQDRKNSHEK